MKRGTDGDTLHHVFLFIAGYFTQKRFCFLCVGFFCVCALDATKFSVQYSNDPGFSYFFTYLFNALECVCKDLLEDPDGSRSFRLPYQNAFTE